jgi:hypothetical protein
MPVPEDVRALVASGRCWGLELEPVWRVLAVTVEPAGGADPVQVLCSPVSVLLASLVRTDDERPAIVTFEAAQLPDVAGRLGGALIGPEPFGAPEPRPGAWGPRLSLEGRSSAPDGTGSTLLLDLEEDAARLRLFARFDAVEVRAGDGRLLAGGT